MGRPPRIRHDGLPRGVALNLLASALTILAAIAFLGTATLAVPQPLSAPANWEVEAGARAFYDAVNVVLRTGETGALDGVAAPDVLLHPPSGGDSDLVGLKRRLAAVQATMPGSRLVVEGVVVAGDHALVTLGRDDATGGSWLGVPYDAAAPFWGNADAVRLVDGRVAEVWGGVAGPLLESFGRAALGPPPAPHSSLAFEEISSAAGSAWAWEPPPRSRVIYVDAGELSIEVDPASLASAIVGTGRGERVLALGTRARVGAGEVIRLPPDARVALHHDQGRTPLRAYEVAFTHAAYVGPLQPDPARRARDGADPGAR